MEVLKLKIFDVLTEKISVSEFENWLYGSEEFVRQININSFYFDLISINYKNEEWLKKFENILILHFENNELIKFIVMNTYTKLKHSKTSKESFLILKNFSNYYNFQTDSIIQNQLYYLYCDFDLLDIGVYDEIELNHIVEYTSNDILKQFNSYAKLEEKIGFINEENTIDNTIYTVQKTEKSTFKQKFLAFFKKI
ncbi:hypothetical protein [Lacinutrix mariniflava]|uniref:hypothetical protein n=1 Tax=Lacinutrix mariniflava TaxID=342955 RepID=UPI0006E3350D|nr:hypothetical protein [Lacinutrix mariniflava]